MAEGERLDHPTGTMTVGHEWDGIEELDTPMPRWWLYILYATIVFAIVFAKSPAKKEAKASPLT